MRSRFLTAALCVVVLALGAASLTWGSVSFSTWQQWWFHADEYTQICTCYYNGSGADVISWGPPAPGCAQDFGLGYQRDPDSGEWMGFWTYDYYGGVFTESAVMVITD